MINPRTILLALGLAALAACSVDPVPDVTYFRLPPPAALPHADKPLSALPIEVETFRGEGVYAEQALIYATTAQADALRAFHYQLWNDPPSRALQARLTGMLRDSGISSLVTDRLPASTPADARTMPLATGAADALSRHLPLRPVSRAAAFQSLLYAFRRTRPVYRLARPRHLAEPG